MNMRTLSRNELSGSGIGVGVSIDPYASDTIVLHNLIQDIYKNITTKPTVIAPGGIFDRGWFQQYLAKTVGLLNVLSHHIYNLGPGNDEHLIDRILNTSILDKGAMCSETSMTLSSWLEKKMGFLCPLGCVICLISYAPCYIMRFLAPDRSYCIRLQFIASARLMTELCGIIGLPSTSCSWQLGIFSAFTTLHVLLVADRTSGGSNGGQHRLRPRLTFKNHWRIFFSPAPAFAHASCSYLLHSGMGRAVYSSVNADKKASVTCYENCI
ncbi:hypothetical protein OROMI_026261 [Orobanche minor]